MHDLAAVRHDPRPSECDHSADLVVRVPGRELENSAKTKLGLVSVVPWNNLDLNDASPEMEESLDPATFNTHPEPNVRVGLRLLVVYLLCALLSTWFWLGHDFSHAGVPHLSFDLRVRHAIGSLCGPLAMPLTYGAGNYDFPAMAIPCAIVVAFAIRRPRYTWARWLGYAAVAFWILMATAIRYQPVEELGRRSPGCGARELRRTSSACLSMASRSDHARRTGLPIISRLRRTVVP